RPLPEQQVGALERDQTQHVVSDVELHDPRPRADAGKVELGPAFVQEVLPVPAVEEQAGLTDALEPRLLLVREKGQVPTGAREVEGVGRSVDPNSRNL